MTEVDNKTTIIKVDSASPDKNIMKMAGDFLFKGKIVIFPTETVYGLGCNAELKSSILKIYHIKNRPENKPLSYHFSSLKNFLAYAGEGLDVRQKNLFLALHDKPVTLIYYDTVRGKKIGIRFPSNAVGKMVLEYANSPVLATSVNFSGESACVSIDCMNNEIFSKVDLVIDAGKCEGCKESTVIDISNSEPLVLREGAYKL